MPPLQPLQVIQKFASKSFQSEDRTGGLYESRDNTHQVVQRYDPNDTNPITKQKIGAWQVHIQPVASGRIDPNKHAFSSVRQATVKDFNDPNSVLSRNSRAATQNLNADKNRLRETPPAAATKKPVERPLSKADRAKQQAVNMVGGVTSAVTSTAGLVRSIPEATGKFAGSVGDLGKAVTNRATGAVVFKTAMNPIVYEKQAAARDAQPLTEQIASNV